MKTVVLYGTKYGTTKKCVDSLCEKIEGDFELIEVSEADKKTIKNADRIIIATPYMLVIFIKVLKNTVKKILKNFLKKMFI